MYAHFPPIVGFAIRQPAEGRDRSARVQGVSFQRRLLDRIAIVYQKKRGRLGDKRIVVTNKKL